jgi:hypothetical protein
MDMGVILVRHPSWRFGKPASAAFEGWLDGSERSGPCRRPDRSCRGEGFFTPQ